jgi:RNA polymerase sigma-70 factor (ECF subfamily)
LYSEIEANQMPDSTQNADRNIDIELLYKALGQLPAKQKEALVLFEISGFSLKEIQEMQGGSLSAVKSRITRGREKLSLMLTETQDPNLTSINSNINTEDRLKLLRVHHD